MFGRKCKQCKAKISKDRKNTEFCSEEHAQEWREKNLTVWQKNLINGIEKYTKKRLIKFTNIGYNKQAAFYYFLMNFSYAVCLIARVG